MYDRCIPREAVNRGNVVEPKPFSRTESPTWILTIFKTWNWKNQRKSQRFTCSTVRVHIIVALYRVTTRYKRCTALYMGCIGRQLEQSVPTPDVSAIGRKRPLCLCHIVRSWNIWNQKQHTFHVSEECVASNRNRPDKSPLLLSPHHHSNRNYQHHHDHSNLNYQHHHAAPVRRKRLPVLPLLLAQRNRKCMR